MSLYDIIDEISQKQAVGADLKKEQIPEEIEKLKALMQVAAANLDFERAIQIRETIAGLKRRLYQR